MARGDLIVQAIDNGLPADQCHTINAVGLSRGISCIEYVVCSLRVCIHNPIV